MEQDYRKILQMQLMERQMFSYPPYFRLIKIVVKHKDYIKGSKVAADLAAALRKNQDWIIMGPESPLVSRIKLWHLKEIWIKVNPKNNLDHMKGFLLKAIKKVKAMEGNSSSQINIDVDPV